MRSFGFCLVLFCLFSVHLTFGQDVQFSQFYANPMYLNPALTGSHSGTYRIMANYRDQWRGTIEQPFTTFSASGDLKFELNNGSALKGNDRVAAGVEFYSDRVGLVEYNTNHISLFGAYHKRLGQHQYLSGGLELGIGQRGINYAKLDFGDEFDGAVSYNNPTQETLPSNSTAYSDMALGLHFSSTPGPDRSVYFGISMHHFNAPSVGFFGNDQRFIDLFEPYILETKTSLHGGASIPLDNPIVIQPRGIYIKQGSTSTFILGSNLKYKIIDSNGVALHLGAWLRATDNLTTFQPTDIILSAGYELNGLLVGFSYDVHLRPLAGSTLGQGIFELSIAYIGEHDNEHEICPQF